MKITYQQLPTFNPNDLSLNSSTERNLSELNNSPHEFSYNNSPDLLGSYSRECEEKFTYSDVTTQRLNYLLTSSETEQSELVTITIERNIHLIDPQLIRHFGTL